MVQWTGSSAALAATVSRVAVVPIAILAMAIWPVAGSAVAAPPATQVITAFPVGPNGEPVNGYQEAPSLGNVTAGIAVVRGQPVGQAPASGDLRRSAAACATRRYNRSFRASS